MLGDQPQPFGPPLPLAAHHVISPGLNLPSNPDALGAPAKGISGSGIKAGGDEDQVGCEGFGDPQHGEEQNGATWIEVLN